MTQSKTEIRCPCVDCKNHLAWKDVTTIRSHLIMRSFLKDYTVWIHHGENAVTVELEEDSEANDYMDACISELVGKMGVHEQGGGGGGDVNDDGGGNDTGGRVGDEDDGDYLEEMLRFVGPEVILRNTKGLVHLKRVKKAAK